MAAFHRSFLGNLETLGEKGYDSIKRVISKFVEVEKAGMDGMLNDSRPFLKLTVNEFGGDSINTTSFFKMMES